MDAHKNARSCPRSREELAKRVIDRGWTLPAAAEAAAMSERRCRYWVGLYRRDRHASFADGDPSPHRRRTIRVEEQQQIVELRRTRMTTRQIASAVGRSRATVARVLQKHGLSRLCSLDPPPPPVRYERERAGELLHVDIKKLGRINGIGHRITGDWTHRHKRSGWEFMHVCIDDASRVAYVEVLADQSTATASGFVVRAVEWFAVLGIKTEGLMSDNGGCYRSKIFAQTCSALSIRHLRTRPYTPRTNGKAERFIQTLLREWAYRFAYQSSSQRTSYLQNYLHFYNRHRSHTSLHDQPPISRLTRNNVLRRDT